MISYFFIVIIFLPTIDVAFYEADSDNSECYDDEDSTSNVTTTTQGPTETYTFPSTTALNSYWRCDQGFRMFKRTLGYWCIIDYSNYTIYPNNIYFNRMQGHEYCSELYGGILTGIASTEERNEIFTWMNSTYGPDGVLFVGAQKYSTCRDVNSVNFTRRCVDDNAFFYYNATYQFLPEDDADYGWADNYPTNPNNAANEDLIYGVFNNSAKGVTDVIGNDRRAGALCGKPAVEVFF
ncbi:unnamed protein product [Caenorhabditis angaria]|uniref:C-type lectin domain-containing protein n=1 Tax=Caenorhabditis angaria TaxID=860376 RepID=A0A9P1IN91_9PELO|nr:unnamed protein product [Caenorhabditis angaria]